MNSNYLQTLAQAVTVAHGCACTHVTTRFVNAMVQGRIVWHGQVETFVLVRHPTARKAYAWSWEDGQGHAHAITMLAVPPINSATDAVQAAIERCRREE